MRYVTFLLFLLVLAIPLGCSHKSSNTINFSSHGKFVVLIFDSTTCPYCKKLHHDLDTNKKLKVYEKKMVIYTIHVDENNTYTLPSKKGKLRLDTGELARMYRFNGYTPYIVFCNKDFKPIVTIPGYLKPNTLVRVFKYIYSRAYKTMNINEYLSTP